MPLFRFDVHASRTPEQVRALLDAAYAAQVEALGTVPHDRYQVVHAHDDDHLHVEDSGLGLDRTRALVMIQVTTSPRTTQQKQDLYRLLAEHLERDAGVGPDDLVVSVVENAPEDWSFGHGRAQYLTGEL